MSLPKVDILFEKATRDIEETWKNEISERIISYEKGNNKTYSSESVLVEARNKIKE